MAIPRRDKIGDVGDDAVWRRTLRQVTAMQEGDQHVRVGVLRGTTAEGYSLVELMAVHEFGTKDGHIPERAPIRRTFAVKQSELAALLAKLAAGVLAGKMTMRTALDLLGSWGATEVKNTISEHMVVPESTEATNAAKNRRAGKPASAPTTTLVDTGRLLGAITWEVK